MSGERITLETINENRNLADKLAREGEVEEAVRLLKTVLLQMDLLALIEFGMPLQELGNRLESEPDQQV